MHSIDLSSNLINSMNNERNKTAQCNKTVRGVNNSINIETKIKRDFMDIDFNRFDGELWLYGLLGAGSLVGGTVIAANIIGAKKKKQTPKVKSKR